MGRNKSAIILALGLVLVGGGCSPKIPTPAINSATSSIDFPACRATNLNFHKLDPENFKSMVTCLNGQNGVVQPYKELFDSMDERDVATLLEVFNNHFSPNPTRRNQSLDVIKKLHAQGDLSTLMNGISVNADAKVIENMAPIISKILVNNESDLMDLRRYLIDLVDKKLLGQGAIALADYFGRINGRSLALIMASDSLTTPQSMKSDQVIDLLVSELKQIIDDGSFLKVLLAFKDPSLQLSSLVYPLDTQERNDLSQYITFATSDKNIFLKLLDMNKMADRGVVCYKKGAQYLSTDNLFLSVGREVLKRSPGAQIDRFFLQTLPLDLSATQANCSFPPGLAEALKEDRDLIRAGYGNGKRALFKALLSSKDNGAEQKVLKSDYYFEASPIFAELGRRGAYPFALNLLGQDVLPTDSSALSQIVQSLEIIGVQENLVRILQTLLSQDLHPLGKSLVQSMGDSRGGLGDIFATLASGVSLSSVSNPFQDALGELLRDEDLLKRLHPIFISILNDPRLSNLIDFTGRLAASGQLEKIIVFLAEILQTQGLPGLPGPALTNSFQRPTTNPMTNIQIVQVGITPVVPRQTFLECKSIEGDIFNGGVNFYSGLQCLNSENSYPHLSKIAGDLKNLNLLDDAAFTFKSLIETSPYFVGAMNQLNLLDKSHELQLLFKLYSWAVENPYAIPKHLDILLQEGFAHKDMPAVLKSLGLVLRTEKFGEIGQSLIDIVTQPAKKIFQSQTDFRLHLKNEDAVRAQIAKWYPTLPKAQIESIFQRAKENFETHNPEWMTHEGSYPILSEKQWRQELFSFLEGILRTTDIQEFILALQQIAKEDHIYEMLSQGIENQTMVLHYFGDGSTVPHIMTIWDELEELVEDANFVYSPLGGGGPIHLHVGVSFEQAVVDSNPGSYVDDMKVVEFLGRRGANLTSLGHDKPNPHFISEWTHFQNMIQNYGGLDLISKNGQLRIFQILYGGLSKATPAGARHKMDSNLNHMGELFHLNNIGFFEQTTLAMASMQSQGKLQYFINNLFGVVQLLGADDIEPLREIILELVTRAKAGDTAPIELILNKIETAQNNNEGYQNIKDALFHVIPAINQLGVQPSGVLKGLVSVIGRPLAFQNTLDIFFESAQSPDDNILTISSNILRLNSIGLGALRKFADILILNDPGDSSNPLGSTISLLSDLYSTHPVEFSQVRKSLTAYFDDPKVKDLHPSRLLRNVFEELKNQQGFGSLFGDLLVDPVSRQRAISLGYGLAKSGDFAQFSQFFDDLVNSGDFEAIVHYIFDNFSVSSINSM